MPNSLIRPGLLTRAALLRFRTLQLGLSAVAGSNSTKGGVPAAWTTNTTTTTLTPASFTNSYILAAGPDEGLPPGQWLEVYGPQVRLLRAQPTNSTNETTPETTIPPNPHPESDLQAIKVILNELFPTHGTERWVEAEKTPIRGAAPGEMLAVWCHAKGVNATEAEMVFENGVHFEDAGQAGWRVLRGARLAFVHQLLLYQQRNNDTNNTNTNANDQVGCPTVLDANALDFSFTHATVQRAVEMGMSPEATQGPRGSPFRFLALSEAAAAAVPDRTHPCHVFVSAIARPSSVGGSFTGLPPRTFDLAAYTGVLLGANHAKDVSEKQTQEAILERAADLAFTVAAVRSGGTVLVSLVSSSPFASLKKIKSSPTETKREGILAEMAARAELGYCVAAAVSRAGRCARVIDEILPTADCPRGSAISLLLSLER